MSFITGFNSNGLVEMRLSFIAASYLRGWFSVDLAILLTDWLFLVVVPNIKAIDILRVGKSVRISRIFRALRLLRFIRMWGVIMEVLDLINSKRIKATFNLAMALAFIIILTHYFAVDGSS